VGLFDVGVVGAGGLGSEWGGVELLWCWRVGLVVVLGEVFLALCWGYMRRCS